MPEEPEEPEEKVHPQTRAEWCSWLTTNYPGNTGTSVVIWRKGSGYEALSDEDIVGHALCFGWVDGKMRGPDEARTMVWVARLETCEAIAALGRRVVKAARLNGSSSMLDDVEDLIVPEDLAGAAALTFGRRRSGRALYDAEYSGQIRRLTSS